VKDTETELKTLMLRGLEGDAPAYRQCLALLGVRLRAYFTRRMSGAPGDVEDLVQETLLAVHIKRATWDTAQPFTAWAHAVARYKLIDHWRRARSARPCRSTTTPSSWPPRNRTPASGWSSTAPWPACPTASGYWSATSSWRASAWPRPGAGRHFRRRGQGRPAPGPEVPGRKDAPCGPMT
jgi:hypothetical protein